MISSTSSTDRTLRPEFVPAPAQVKTARPSHLDQISTESATFLRTELQRQPEIRPEVVARAKALAEDPNYPPADVVRNVAEQILNSPDLSESEA